MAPLGLCIMSTRDSVARGARTGAWDGGATAGAVRTVAVDALTEVDGAAAHLGDNMEAPKGVPVGVDPKSDKPAGVGGIDAQLSGTNLVALVALFCITSGWPTPLGLSGIDIIEFVDKHFRGSGFVLGRALPTLTAFSSENAASAKDSFKEKFEAHLAGAVAMGDGIGEAADDGIISMKVFFTCVSVIFAKKGTSFPTKN